MIVSIIIPVSNSMPHLVNTVESILKNTKYPFEIIFVESESTDGTKEYTDYLAKTNKKIKVYHTKKEGLVKAFNYGMKQTKNDVYLTHDDCIVPNLYKRDWLTSLVNASKGKNVAMSTTILAGGISDENYFKGFKWIGTWSMFIKRETLDKIGYLDENMCPGDDIDFCFRIYKAGLKIAICDFWIEHHRKSEHVENRTEYDKLVKKMGEYFRKKHNIR